MIILLLTILVLFFCKPVNAKSLSYQFILPDNSINLDFWAILDLPVQQSAEAKPYLSFSYTLTSQTAIPDDLALFLVEFDKQVVFYATADSADGLSHTVELDLSADLDQLPIFYQNSYINDLSLVINDFKFVERPTETASQKLSIQGLSVIRELDQSLTVLLTLSEEFRKAHHYRLVCLDEQGEVLESVALLKNDDFLWPNSIFTHFLSNQNHELIFHLAAFTCQNAVYVVADSYLQSEVTSIIGVNEL